MTCSHQTGRKTWIPACTSCKLCSVRNVQACSLDNRAERGVSFAPLSIHGRISLHFSMSRLRRWRYSRQSSGMAVIMMALPVGAVSSWFPSVNGNTASWPSRSSDNSSKTRSGKSRSCKRSLRDQSASSPFGSSSCKQVRKGVLSGTSPIVCSHSDSPRWGDMSSPSTSSAGNCLSSPFQAFRTPPLWERRSFITRESKRSPEAGSGSRGSASFQP